MPTKPPLSGVTLHYFPPISSLFLPLLLFLRPGAAKHEGRRRGRSSCCFTCAPSSLLSVPPVVRFVYLQFMPRPYRLAFFPLDFLSSSVSVLALLCLTSGRLCPLMLSQWTLVLLMWDNGTNLKGYRALRTVSFRASSFLFPLFDLSQAAS